jgi:hypothetical protein
MTSYTIGETNEELLGTGTKANEARGGELSRPRDIFETMGKQHRVADPAVDWLARGGTDASLDVRETNMIGKRMRNGVKFLSHHVSQVMSAQKKTTTHYKFAVHEASV